MSPLNAGQVLNNRYRIVKRIGGGGFGDIYRAWDLNLGRACAIKENLETSLAAQQQFEQEAKFLARLSHPNLARVTDYFFVPALGKYLVMDYIEGHDLQDLLNQSGPLALDQARVWINQVCSALTYLHNQDPPIIHRDIKPANIKIAPDGKAVLVDFGIAKAYDPDIKTTVGARAVTPGYSPPEQYGQGRTDGRTDIYALGATLYTLLTGQEPPESVQISAGQAALLPVRTLNSGVTAVVEIAIQRAMNTRPDGRYQDIAAFQSALHATRPRPRLPPRILSLAWSISLAVIILTGLAYFIVPGLTDPIPAIQTASPKGYILFTSDRDGSTEIYRMSDAGDVVRLTNAPSRGSNSWPVPDPEGYIFYVSTQEGNHEIYRLDGDGNAIRITHTINGESKDPIHNPSGYLLFSSNRDG